MTLSQLPTHQGKKSLSTSWTQSILPVNLVLLLTSEGQERGSDRRAPAVPAMGPVYKPTLAVASKEATRIRTQPQIRSETEDSEIRTQVGGRLT